jgi:hypothetical protein
MIMNIDGFIKVLLKDLRDVNNVAGKWIFLACFVGLVVKVDAEDAHSIAK